MFKFLGKILSSPLGQIASAFLPGIGPVSSTVVRTLAGGLGTLYANQQQAKAAEQAFANSQAQLQQNQQQLASLFGPTSSYAQQLRQELERKDAAAGRRSQYGTREVELQSRLAGLAAQYAPGMMNANNTANTAAYGYAQARNRARGQNMSVLDQMAKDTGIYDTVGKGLESIFGSQTPNQAPTVPDYDMGSQDYGYGYGNY